MAQILSLEQCLREAISPPIITTAPSERHMWAILEGFGEDEFGAKIGTQRWQQARSRACMGAPSPKARVFLVSHKSHTAIQCAVLHPVCGAAPLFRSGVDLTRGAPLRLGPRRVPSAARQPRAPSAIERLPEFGPLLRAVALAPMPAQAMWRYALALMLIDDEKVRIVETRQEGERLHLTLQTLVGERFEVVRPPMAEATEQLLLEQIRTARWRGICFPDERQLKGLVWSITDRSIPMLSRSHPPEIPAKAHSYYTCQGQIPNVDACPVCEHKCTSCKGTSQSKEQQ